MWTAHDSTASINTEIVKPICQERKEGNEEGGRKEERGRRRERLINLFDAKAFITFILMDTFLKCTFSQQTFIKYPPGAKYFY